jgi:hypothetical protein
VSLLCGPCAQDSGLKIIMLSALCNLIKLYNSIARLGLFFSLSPSSAAAAAVVEVAMTPRWLSCRVYSRLVSITTRENLVVLKESQNVMKVDMNVIKRLISKRDITKITACTASEISDVGGRDDCGCDDDGCGDADGVVLLLLGSSAAVAVLMVVVKEMNKIMATTINTPSIAS